MKVKAGWESPPEPGHASVTNTHNAVILLDNHHKAFDTNKTNFKRGSAKLKYFLESKWKVKKKQT